MALAAFRIPFGRITRQMLAARVVENPWLCKFIGRQVRSLLGRKACGGHWGQRGVQQVDDKRPEADPPAGNQNSAAAENTFDKRAYMRALKRANPWAQGLPIVANDPRFLVARREACIDRQVSGRDHWNAWADAMLELKASLEKAGRWRIVDRTGYWAARVGEPTLDEGENVETSHWLDLAYCDFRGHTFGPSPLLIGFRFPGVADFGVLEMDKGRLRTTFPDGVNFAGAVFDDHALFPDTHLGGGGANFIEAQFDREAYFLGTIFEGETEFNRAKFTGIATFDAAEFHGLAAMADASFKEWLSLAGTVFHELATFERAHFHDDASFADTVFEDFALFKGAIFACTVFLYSAHFLAGGSFINTTFGGDVYFSPPPDEADRSGPCHFPGVMIFRRTVFEGAVTFENATFDYESDFVAIQAKSLFSLAGVTFNGIPDFSQADFKQAPQLDQARFFKGTRMPTREHSLDRLARSRGSDDEKMELPARYRALKRLAIQSHDFARELDFHAEELMARRGLIDHPFGRGMGSYWFGVVYQVSSDFGRSLYRPLACWLIMLVLSAGAYFAARLVQPDRCSPLESAAYLGLRKGLSIVNAETSEKLKQAYGCLYGYEASSLGGTATVARVPYVVETVTTAQVLLSAVFLFLFGLALRNRFRIG